MTEYTELDELADIYSDVYKSVHGIRPRWVSREDHTVEWYRAELEQLSRESDLQFQEDLRLEALAIEAVEKHIASIIAMGAGDRDSAIAWLHDAHDTNYDNEFLCWHLGVPYGYFNTKKAA